MQYTYGQIKRLLERGFICAVVVQLDYADKKAGQILSTHKSHAAAELKARGNTFVRIAYLSELYRSAI